MTALKDVTSKIRSPSGVGCLGIIMDGMSRKNNIVSSWLSRSDLYLRQNQVWITEGISKTNLTMQLQSNFKNSWNTSDRETVVMVSVFLPYQECHRNAIWINVAIFLNLSSGWKCTSNKIQIQVTVITVKIVQLYLHEAKRVNIPWCRLLWEKSEIAIWNLFVLVFETLDFLDYYNH